MASAEFLPFKGRLGGVIGCPGRLGGVIGCPGRLGGVIDQGPGGDTVNQTLFGKIDSLLDEKFPDGCFGDFGENKIYRFRIVDVVKKAEL